MPNELLSANLNCISNSSNLQIYLTLDFSTNTHSNESIIDFYNKTKHDSFLITGILILRKEDKEEDNNYGN